MRNTSYVKIYENGILTNPITKEKPFIVQSRADRRKARRSNNRKGFGTIVVKVGPLSFMRYKIIKQITNKGLITHSILSNTN